jgi:hypothetical protein
MRRREIQETFVCIRVIVVIISVSVICNNVAFERNAWSGICMTLRDANVCERAHRFPRHYHERLEPLQQNNYLIAEVKRK